MSVQKREIENRTFTDSWENQYLFIVNKQKKNPQCLICLNINSGTKKKFNSKRHYMTNYSFKYETYIYRCCKRDCCN